MSIRTMSIVWAHSKQSGSGLLVMLAIADIGNDSGEAYPGIPRLAGQVRLSERGLQKLMAKIVESQELIVEPRFITDEQGKGKQSSNLYSIILPGLNNRHALKKYPAIGCTTVHPPGELASSPPPRTTVHPPGELASSPESLSDPLSDPLPEQSGAEAARNNQIKAIVEVWVKGWAGAVSGNPYSNKTYRADAGKLADSTSLEDIKRYTLAKAADKRWVNQRPSWGIWFNDLGAWLAANPAQPEPGKKQYGSETDLSESQRIALENMNKVMRGKQTT